MHPASSSTRTTADLWEPYPALAAARVWSQQRVEEIRSRLTGLRTEVSTIRSVVLVGSLARLDACAESDGDLIIVVDDATDIDDDAAVKAVSATWARLRPLDLRQPDPEGIYATASSRQQLCDGPRGVVDEALDIFGKRIQLLLEPRAVLGRDACTQLQRSILLRYAQHPFANRQGELWSYLTDDLIRYWRSYRVWRHWDTSTRSGGWYLRNLKLQHSRLLSFASLLIVCVYCTPDKSSVESLLRLVSLTPLERIWSVDQQVGAQVSDEISSRYDRFLQLVNDASVRQMLERVTPTSSQHALDEAPREFTDVLDNADGIRVALLHLLRKLPSAQSERALASLIF